MQPSKVVDDFKGDGKKYTLALRLEGKSGSTEFGASVGADLGRYGDSKDDNYDNYNYLYQPGIEYNN